MQTREIEVSIQDFRLCKTSAIKKACKKCWPFKKLSILQRASYAVLSGSGIATLKGNETEPELVDRLTEAIWKANKEYCQVVVVAMPYLNQNGCEVYHLTSDQYDDWKTKETK